MVAVSQLAINSVSRLHFLSLNANRNGLRPPSACALRILLCIDATGIDSLPHFRGRNYSRFTSLTVLCLFCTAYISQSKVLEFLRGSTGLKRVEGRSRYPASHHGSNPVSLGGFTSVTLAADRGYHLREDPHLPPSENLICHVAGEVIILIQPDISGRLEASPFQSSWGFLPRSSKVHTVGLRV